MADPSDVLTAALMSQQPQFGMPFNNSSSLNAAQSAAPSSLDGNVTPAFNQADAFTSGAEGGVTKNDGNGGTAAYGIDQNAHPGTDVSQMTPQHAQAMRYEYWRSIGGDQLAQQSPPLAMAAYDTAIMSGPPQAQKFIQASGGDPNKFMALRNAYLTSLGQKPGFQGAALGWANRNQALGQAMKQPGPNPVYQPNNAAMNDYSNG